MWRMKRSILKTAIVLVFVVLIAGVSTLSAGTQNLASSKHASFNLNLHQKSIDMLIFISPQYTEDIEIENAINLYIKAVKDDLGWNTKIIKIQKEDNEYAKIDEIIEHHYSLYGIKACIMVGEDIDTPLAGDCDYMEKPSMVPWFTTGGAGAYETSEQGIICKPYKMDICISLIYPTHDLNYQTKKLQIINSFVKFSNNRTIKFSDDILVFESSDINANSKETYKKLGEQSNLNYKQDPKDLDVQKSLEKSHSLYFVHGHSNPSGTILNAKEKSWFSAKYIDELDSPFFGADGCYVAGWWSNKKDNDILDASICDPYYGSEIFSSKNTRAMVLGLLSQTGYPYSVCFVENAISDLIGGKTLAESMMGDIYLGDNIVIGDPTFHFTC
jgi:hypothetical protein